MFTSLIFNNKLKYIGLAIVVILIIIPIYMLGDTLYTKILHIFGGETKQEKILRLEKNTVVKDNIIKITKANSSLQKKKEKIAYKIIIKNSDNKIKIDKKTNKITTDFDKRIERIKRKIKFPREKNIIKHKRIHKNLTIKRHKTNITINKPRAIVKVVNKEKYVDAGNAIIDSLNQAYNLANNI